jgi:methyl-accepting chemotaxis protein
MDSTKNKNTGGASPKIHFGFSTIQGKINSVILTLGLASGLAILLFRFLAQKQGELQQELLSLYAPIVDNQSKVISMTNDLDSLQTWYSILTWLTVLLIVGFCVAAVSFLFSSTFQQLKTIEDKLDEISKGNLPDRLSESNNELGVITSSINSLIGNLSQVKVFSEEVGNGHFDSKVVVFNNEGTLGQSLANMRKSLREVAEGDQMRNWTSDGIAKFAQLLRQNNSNLEELCHVVVSELVKYIGGIQGAIFILEEKDREQVLEMKACYAYERRKFLNKTIKIGEGLAGQVFLEKETVMMTEVPTNYHQITSGLGESLPKSVLIVPLKLNEQVTGVLELASFQVFQQKDINLVEKVAESMASTVSSVRIAQETNKLLEESLSSGEQLRAQEEEMRQNLEEMQAIQEQLQRQTNEMRKVQDSLILEKSMFLVLMENLPDRLTYKDEECRVIRVNNAKAKRFNRTPDQMIGTTDYDFFPAEHAAKAVEQDKDLMRIGKPMLDIQEKVLFDNGDVMFNNTSRLPFRNEEGVIIGSFCMTKDITQQKMMENTIEQQSKLIKQVASTMPIFSYQVDKLGNLCNINTGNLNGISDGIKSQEGKTFSEIFPDVYAVASKIETDELITCESSVDVEGTKKKFKHFLFHDSVYKKAYWGFALQY